MPDSLTLRQAAVSVSALMHTLGDSNLNFVKAYDMIREDGFLLSGVAKVCVELRKRDFEVGEGYYFYFRVTVDAPYALVGLSTAKTKEMLDLTTAAYDKALLIEKIVEGHTWSRDEFLRVTSLEEGL